MQDYLDKVMKNILLLLCAILLIGAGCASAEPAPDFDTVPEPIISTDGSLDTSVSVDEDPVDDIAVNEVSSEATNYRMSTSIVAFIAPEGTTVRQLDAGGVSVVYIEEVFEDYTSNSASISIYSATTFEGEQISFEDWKKDKGFSESGRNREDYVIDGVAFEQHYVPEEDEHHTIFIGSITGDSSHHVKITITEREEHITDDLLNSIIFYGDDTELEGYEFIR